MAEAIMFWAIPAFFLLIGIELVAARVMGRAVYRANDAIASLSLGVMSQVAGVFTKALTIGIYAVAVEHVALFELSATSPWVWIAGLVLYDFCYYWLHRAGHEVNLLWAAHVVHHQSERYNLTTALRQTSSGALFGWVFYLPMAVLGFPLEVFAVVAVIDLLYQFWIHTELVPKLGWFDRVFASPSNHRAHHAVNERYLDKNYGGLFILWDRLFGTFVEENDSDPVVYGTRAPLRSFNPLWANLEVYAALWRDTWRTARWRDRLRLWFGKPGWRPADLVHIDPKPAFDIGRPEFDPPATRALTAYVLVNFALLLVPAVHFLVSAGAMPAWQSGGYALGLVASLVVLGALMEGRRGSKALEVTRWIVIASALAVTASSEAMASGAVRRECIPGQARDSDVVDLQSRDLRADLRRYLAENAPTSSDAIAAFGAPHIPQPASPTDRRWTWVYGKSRGGDICTGNGVWREDAKLVTYVIVDLSWHAGRIDACTTTKRTFITRQPRPDPFGPGAVDDVRRTCAQFLEH